MDDEFIKNSKPSDYIKKVNNPPKTNEDLCRLTKSNGLQRALENYWCQYYMAKFKKNPELISDEYASLLADLQNLKDDHRAKDAWLIVINPKKDIDVEAFRNKCLIARQKKWIVESKLWFEWRSKEFSSIHANFAIRGKYSPSRVKQEFYNSFKEFIGEDEKMRDIYINIQRDFSDRYKIMCEYQFQKGKYQRDGKMRDVWNSTGQCFIADDYKYDGRPVDRKKKK